MHVLWSFHIINVSILENAQWKTFRQKTIDPVKLNCVFTKVIKIKLSTQSSRAFLF
jgi:hypothetical protein